MKEAKCSWCCSEYFPLDCKFNESKAFIFFLWAKTTQFEQSVVDCHMPFHAKLLNQMEKEFVQLGAHGLAGEI